MLWFHAHDKTKTILEKSKPLLEEVDNLFGNSLEVEIVLPSKIPKEAPQELVKHIKLISKLSKTELIRYYGGGLASEPFVDMQRRKIYILLPKNELINLLTPMGVVHEYIHGQIKYTLGGYLKQITNRFLEIPSFPHIVDPDEFWASLIEIAVGLLHMPVLATERIRKRLEWTHWAFNNKELTVFQKAKFFSYFAGSLGGELLYLKYGKNKKELIAVLEHIVDRIKAKKILERSLLDVVYASSEVALKLI